MVLEKKWLVLQGWKGNANWIEGSCRLQCIIFISFSEDWRKSSPTGDYRNAHQTSSLEEENRWDFFVLPPPHHFSIINITSGASSSTSEMPWLGVGSVMFSWRELLEQVIASDSSAAKGSVAVQALGAVEAVRGKAGLSPLVPLSDPLASLLHLWSDGDVCNQDLGEIRVP